MRVFLWAAVTLAVVGVLIFNLRITGRPGNQIAPELAGRVSSPSVLQRFPDDLIAPGVDYSGIELDGWLRRQASVTLAGGPAAVLQLRAEVLVAPGGQRLQLLVNGQQVAARKVAPGSLQLRVPLPASEAPRQVMLRWAMVEPIDPPRDPRRAAALLRFLGLVPRGGSG